MGDRINILLIISDQHRRDAAGCYGHPMVRTPNLDRLASMGTQFNRAYCQSPLCGPSRASIQTGQYPHTCRALDNNEKVPVRVDAPWMGETFRRAGYVTGAIGKMHVMGETPERDLGYDERRLRFYTYDLQDYIDVVGEENKDRYMNNGVDIYNRENKPVDLAEELMFDALVVERSKQFLNEHRDGPFFLCMGLEKPHPAWWAPSEFHDMYKPEDIDLPDDFGQKPVNVPESQHWRMVVKDKVLERFSEPAARNATAAYYANVSYMDHNLGQLLSAVADLGLMDNTLIVYTSDHGEMLFDHTLIQKGYMYEGAVAVPLICVHPEHFPAGAQCDEIVQLLDLFPTFMDAAGMEHPEGLEGESLLPVARGEADTEGRAAFSEFYTWGSPWRMIRTPEFKYVHQDTEIPQLYDMVNDPCETANLATDAGFKAACAELHERVMADWEIPPQEEMIPRHGMYPWRGKPGGRDPER